MDLTYLGNKELLHQHKVGFLCSRIVSSRSVMRCYDWATDINVENNVIVGGFQSKIEKDVLHLLFKHRVRIVWVLARSIYKEIPAEWQPLLSDGRLLIISTQPNALRVSKSAADSRNQYVAHLSEQLVFGYIGEGSSLNKVYEDNMNKSKIL